MYKNFLVLLTIVIFGFSTIIYLFQSIHHNLKKNNNEPSPFLFFQIITALIFSLVALLGILYYFTDSLDIFRLFIGVIFLGTLGIIASFIISFIVYLFTEDKKNTNN